jgi:hypothetical protein
LPWAGGEVDPDGRVDVDECTPLRFGGSGIAEVDAMGLAPRGNANEIDRGAIRGGILLYVGGIQERHC